MWVCNVYSAVPTAVPAAAPSPALIPGRITPNRRVTIEIYFRTINSMPGFDFYVRSAQEIVEKLISTQRKCLISNSFVIF